MCVLGFRLSVRIAETFLLYQRRDVHTSGSIWGQLDNLSEIITGRDPGSTAQALLVRILMQELQVKTSW